MRPSESHAAGSRLDDSGDEPQQGRLAGAVAPDEADRLPASDLDRDVAERPDVGRLRLPPLDEEVLQRASFSPVNPEAARDAFDRDLADFHGA